MSEGLDGLCEYYLIILFQISWICSRWKKWTHLTQFSLVFLRYKSATHCTSYKKEARAQKLKWNQKRLRIKEFDHSFWNPSTSPFVSDYYRALHRAQIDSHFLWLEKMLQKRGSLRHECALIRMHWDRKLHLSFCAFVASYYYFFSRFRHSHK